MKPASFEYHAPATVDETVALLSELGDGAKVRYAGGQSLVPLLALRLAVFDHLVDLRRVEELRGIERRNGGIHIGAATPQAAVERSDDVAVLAPLLAGHSADRALPDPKSRDRGWLHRPCRSGCGVAGRRSDARRHPRSRIVRGQRSVPASSFFTGACGHGPGSRRDPGPGSRPILGGRCGFAIEEFARRHGDFAIAGVAAAIRVDNDDLVADAAASVSSACSRLSGAARPRPKSVGQDRLSEIDAEEVGQLAVSDGWSPFPRIFHGSAQYRKRGWRGNGLTKRGGGTAREEAGNA